LNRSHDSFGLGFSVESRALLLLNEWRFSMIGKVSLSEASMWRVPGILIAVRPLLSAEQTSRLTRCVHRNAQFGITISMSLRALARRHQVAGRQIAAQRPPNLSGSHDLPALGEHLVILFDFVDRIKIIDHQAVRLRQTVWRKIAKEVQSIQCALSFFDFSDWQSDAATRDVSDAVMIFPFSLGPRGWSSDLG